MILTISVASNVPDIAYVNAIACGDSGGIIIPLHTNIVAIMVSTAMANSMYLLGFEFTVARIRALGRSILLPTTRGFLKLYKNPL